MHWYIMNIISRCSNRSKWALVCTIVVVFLKRVCACVYIERERDRCIKYILVHSWHCYRPQPVIFRDSPRWISSATQRASALRHSFATTETLENRRYRSVTATYNSCNCQNQASGLALGLTLYLIALRLGVQTLEMVRGYGDGDCDGYYD